jgi:1-deoxy-D-xylulose-5-phosphate synthase
VPDADAFARAPQPLIIGEWQVVVPGRDAVLLAVGSMVEAARAARPLLAARGLDVGVVNARFVKPLDTALLERLAAAVPLLVTIEENALAGGFGSQVARALGAAGEAGPKPRLLQLGLPDAFVPHAARDELLSRVGLTAERIAARTAEALWAARDIEPASPDRGAVARR